MVDPAYGGQQPGQLQSGNGMAVAALVLGILALVLCWIPLLNWVLAVLAIIFGALGIGRGKRVGRGGGMAIAGLVCGVIGGLIGVALVVLVVQAKTAAQHDLRLRVEEAEHAAEQATEQANQARDEVERAQKDLAELGGQIDQAVAAVAGAQSEADRAAAKVKLDALQKQKADLEFRLSAAKRTQREQGMHIRKECLDNPLAPGCS